MLFIIQFLIPKVQNTKKHGMITFFIMTFFTCEFMMLSSFDISSKYYNIYDKLLNFIISRMQQEFFYNLLSEFLSIN